MIASKVSKIQKMLFSSTVELKNWMKAQNPSKTVKLNRMNNHEENFWLYLLFIILILRKLFNLRGNKYIKTRLIRYNEQRFRYNLKYHKSRMSYNEADLRKAVDAVFNSYDADKSGTLEAQEVASLINDALKQMQQTRKVTQAEVDQFISSVDSNNDKKINKEELFEIFKKVVNTHKWFLIDPPICWFTSYINFK